LEDKHTKKLKATFRKMNTETENDEGHSSEDNLFLQQKELQNTIGVQDIFSFNENCTKNKKINSIEDVNSVKLDYLKEK